MTLALRNKCACRTPKRLKHVTLFSAETSHFFRSTQHFYVMMRFHVVHRIMHRSQSFSLPSQNRELFVFGRSHGSCVCYPFRDRDHNNNQEVCEHLLRRIQGASCSQIPVIVSVRDASATSALEVYVSPVVVLNTRVLERHNGCCCVK